MPGACCGLVRKEPATVGFDPYFNNCIFWTCMTSEPIRRRAK